MSVTTVAVTAGQWLMAAAVLLSTALAEAQPTSTAPSGDVFSSSTNCQTVYQQTAAQINAQHSRDWPACGGASACIRAANAKKADALKKANQDLRLCQASGGGTPPPTATDAPPGGPRPLDTIVLPPPRDRQPVEIPPPNTDVGPPPSPGKRRSPPFEPAVRPSVPPTPPPTGVRPNLQPLPAPTVAPGFQPGRPGTWKPQDVTWKGEKWAVYTDPKGQPWRFPPQYVEAEDPNRKDLGNTWILDRKSIDPNGSLNGKRVPMAKYMKQEFLGEGRLTGAYALKPGQEVDNFPYAR